MNERISPDLFLADDKKAWFTHDRFGMFIHWGLYSLAARHEWVKNREEIDDAGYQRYFETSIQTSTIPRNGRGARARPE